MFAGNATGMMQDEVSNNGIICSIEASHMVIARSSHRSDDEAIEDRRLRIILRTAVCCVLTTCAVRTSSAVRPEFSTGAGGRYDGSCLARLTRAPA